MTASLWPLQEPAEELVPQRKKGRANAQGRRRTAPQLPRDCVEAVHAVVQGVLAVAADVVRLLAWDRHHPSAVATFALATNFLAWADTLAAASAGTLCCD